MRKQSDSDENQFEKDYQEILLKLKNVTEDSETIGRAVEQNLNANDLAELMTLMRERMPKAIQTLGQIHQFLTNFNQIRIQKQCGEKSGRFSRGRQRRGITDVF